MTINAVRLSQHIFGLSQHIFGAEELPHAQIHSGMSWINYQRSMILWNIAWPSCKHRTTDMGKKVQIGNGSAIFAWVSIKWWVTCLHMDSTMTTSHSKAGNACRMSSTWSKLKKHKFVKVYQQNRESCTSQRPAPLLKRSFTGTYICFRLLLPSF